MLYQPNWTEFDIVLILLFQKLESELKFESFKWICLFVLYVTSERTEFASSYRYLILAHSFTFRFVLFNKYVFNISVLKKEKICARLNRTIFV